MADRGEEDEDAADATQAFEDLRAEVAVLRQAVEVLPGAWAANRPPDTTLTLGAVVKGLAGVAGRLEAIGQHPALRLTPDQHRQAIAQAGQGVLREAVLQLERAAQAVADERRQLGELVGGARQQSEQRAWLATTGLAALVAGLVLSPLVASALPFGLNGRVAALVMQDDRWAAGVALMRAASPATWEEVAAAFQLTQVNSAALDACGAAAAKARQDQRCTITVPAH